jgi:flagellar basal-body rod protein FlgB
MGQIFDKTLRALATSSKMRELRQGVLAANVANVETPNYKAKKLDFEEALKSALAQESFNQQSGDHILSDTGAIKQVGADIYDNPDIELSNDGNTVDLEKEMASMVENNIMYRAATQMINKKLAALKYAATDGGR